MSYYSYYAGLRSWIRKKCSSKSKTSKSSKNVDEEDEDLYNSELFLRFYKFENYLGSGAFGTVYKVKHSFDEGEYAFKVLQIQKMDRRKEIDGRRRAAREIRCLMQLDHPNILRYHCAFEIRKFPEDLNELPPNFPQELPLYCIQTQLCDDITLKEKIIQSNNGNKDELKKFVIQIADAVKHFHKCDIMHRDLKPQNILIKTDVYGEQNVKIGDFGLGRFYDVEQGDLTRNVGTRLYQCMEMRDSRKEYDLRCDVYSLGVTFYQMFLDIPSQFDGESQIKAFLYEKLGKLARVANGIENYEQLPRISEGFNGLIIRMLQVQENRPSSEDVYKELIDNPSWLA